MNMQNLMAQAQRLQKDIQKKQEEINKTEYEGKSQIVQIIINGKKEIVKINIDKEVIKDADDLEVLEDMIKIAFNEAIKKVEEDTEKKLGVYSKGLNGLI